MKVNLSHGRKLAFLDRYDIPDLLDVNDTYLTRWRILETPWFAIYLHAIRRPDNDRHLHDHPWSFYTLVLRGGYIERYVTNRRMALSNAKGRRFDHDRHWPVLSLHRMPHGAFHAITRLADVPTWTLLFVGRNRSDWGYATSDGWVDHETYHHQRNPVGFP